MPADVLEDLFLLARIRIANSGPSHESLEGIGAQPIGSRHRVALHQTDIVDEDLAQAPGRVRNIDRAAAILLSHDGCLGEACIGLLAHCGEHLDVMVDPAELIRDLHQAELREVPHVRR